MGFKSTSAMPAAAPYTPASLKKQTVPELRALCTDIGVESFGRKDDLITRVLGASTPAKKAAPPTPTSVAPRVADLKSWLSEHGLSTKGLKDELLTPPRGFYIGMWCALRRTPCRIEGYICIYACMYIYRLFIDRSICEVILEGTLRTGLK